MTLNYSALFDGSNAETMQECIELALQLADSTARADIETECMHDGGTIETGLLWNTRRVRPIARKYVKRALRYIELRGDALPYTVERDGALVRFGEK